MRGRRGARGREYEVHWWGARGRCDYRGSRGLGRAGVATPATWRPPLNRAYFGTFWALVFRAVARNTGDAVGGVEQTGRCDACGRALPVRPGPGPGRKRQVCDATCRSSARRQRAASSSGAGSRAGSDTESAPAPAPSAAPDPAVGTPGPARHVNASLTERKRKEIIDNVPETPGNGALEA